MNKTFSEKKLAKKCIARDSKALERMYILYAPYMKGICIRYMTDISLAEDVLQDGFIKAFENITKFTWQQNGSLKAWLSRIFVNCCIDTLKAQKKIQHISFDENITEIENDDDETLISIIHKAGINQEKLIEILSLINENNRVVFNLYAIDELKHKEISDTIGISIEASRARLKRARIEIKTILIKMYSHELKTEVI